MTDVSVRVDAPAGTFLGLHREGALRFLGMPYAEAPIGALRFAEPRRRATLDAPFEAHRHGATPQRLPLWDRTTIPEPSIPGDDTLTLDIVAPPDATNAPVLFWIHGGGFVAGSPASPWFDGGSFARDGVVVVTASYRLGIDGFGEFPGAPSNRGLKDLVMALEWVNENIASFGGDPARVTIAGQSAGGGAVLALMASPASVDLFSAAISLSGVELAFDSEALRDSTKRIAAHLGVAPTPHGFGGQDDGSATRAIRELSSRGAFAMPTPLAPRCGDDFLPLPIMDALASRSRHIPLLLGATADEFDGGPTIEDPSRRALSQAEAEAARASGKRVTDSLFRAVCVRAAFARRAAAAGTWLYSFDWPSPVSQGATHCIDLPFFFDRMDAEGVVDALGQDAPRGLATAMHADAVAFVRGGGALWPVARGRGGDPARVYDASGGAAVASGRFDACLQYVAVASGKDG